MKLVRPLPHLAAGPCLTDGGLETTLVFHEGIDLPHFAAFTLLSTPLGRATLRAYYERYLRIAAAQGLGFVLEAPTWRSNPDWGERLGLSAEDLDCVNHDAVQLMAELRDAWRDMVAPIVVSGCVGPRGDGYVAGEAMSPEQAFVYHWAQVAAFARAGADMVCAITMTNAPEAIGVVQAARREGLPVATSFTLETDGRLPTGQPLGEAIDQVDAATDGYAAYFMINCAHPDHFAGILAADAPWLSRIGGIRANASRRSHEELNESADLDDGDPAELASDHAALLRRLPGLKVLGGCCGTDHRHVEAIGRVCVAA